MKKKLLIYPLIITMLLNGVFSYNIYATEGETEEDVNSTIEVSNLNETEEETLEVTITEEENDNADNNETDDKKEDSEDTKEIDVTDQEETEETEDTEETEETEEAEETEETEETEEIESSEELSEDVILSEPTIVPKTGLNIVESNYCGDNAIYTVYNNYTMEIEGYGPLYDCTNHGYSEQYLKVTSVTIHEGITSIGANAFSKYSALSTIYIPDGVEYIGANAFSGTIRLRAVFIPESVVDIGGGTYASSAFFNSALSLEVYTPSSGKSWNQYAAYRTSDTMVNVYYGSTREDSVFWSGTNFNQAQIIIPEGVTFIPDYFFMNNGSIKDVVLPSTLRKIGDYAFYLCENLRTITQFPESLNYIGEYSFWHCVRLVSPIIIPEGITEIKQKTFTNCENLKYVSLPASLKNICFYAFEDNYNLLRVDIPENSQLEFIDEKAFRQCGSLKYLFIPSTIKTIAGPYEVAMCPFSTTKNVEIFIAVDKDLPGFGPLWTYGTKAVHYGATYQDYYDAVNSTTYTIHYNSNDPRNLNYDEEAFYDINTQLSGEIYSREGYKFQGWNTKPDGSGTYYRAGSYIKRSYTFKEKDITLYAQWNPLSYQITYYTNGGQPISRNPSSYLAGSDIKLYPCKKNGYKFLGWYTNPNGTGEPVTSTKDKYSKLVLYAIYEIENYRLTVNPNGGTLAPKQRYDARLVQMNDRYMGIFNAKTTSYRLPNLIKPGYTFKGWTDSATGSTVTTIASSYGKNLTVNAVFIPVTYRITYYNNSGTIKTGTVYTTSYTLNTTRIILPNSSNISRNGYTFAGWYDNRLLTGDPITSISSSEAKNFTLYAKWVKN